MPAKNTYQYPLHNEGDYKGRIRFTLFAESYLNTGLSDVLDDKKSALKDLDEKRQDLNDQVVEEQKESGVVKSTTRSILDRTKLEIQELTADLRAFDGATNNVEVGSKPRQLVDTEVLLYLPQGLQFRDNVTYENVDVGMTGAAVSKGASIAGSMADGIGSFVEGLSGGAKDDIAKLATVRLAQSMGKFSEEVTAGLKLQTGVTTNPNSRSLFKQVNMREFQFNFKMVARSKKESDQIKKIVKLFRSELYPEDIEVTVGGQEISLGYKFPNKFNIEFEYDSKTIAHKVKPCFLRSVDTTYNASQMAFHDDGEFLEVDMNLNFTETVTLSKKDILETDADGVGF
jgi:hypothetical protein